MTLLFNISHEKNSNQWILGLTQEYEMHVSSNLILWIEPFCYTTKNVRQIVKYLENEKSFWDEIKNIFYHFWSAFSCQKLSQTWECAFKKVYSREIVFSSEFDLKLLLNRYDGPFLWYYLTSIKVLWSFLRKTFIANVWQSSKYSFVRMLQFLLCLMSQLFADWLLLKSKWVYI